MSAALYSDGFANSLMVHARTDYYTHVEAYSNLAVIVQDKLEWCVSMHAQSLEAVVASIRWSHQVLAYHNAVAVQGHHAAISCSLSHQVLSTGTAKQGCSPGTRATMGSSMILSLSGGRLLLPTAHQLSLGRMLHPCTSCGRHACRAWQLVPSCQSMQSWSLALFSG